MHLYREAKERDGPVIGVRRKFLWGVSSVAYGGHLYFVCTVCDVTI